MGDFPPYFDIILFAMIAAFLVLRLRSVLGRRTGNERRRDPLLRRAEAASDNIIALGQRGNGKAPAAPATPPPTDAVAAGLAQIRNADPGFDPVQFVEGVRVAFDLIVSAFASGDKARLRPLLSDEVFTRFCAAIDERNTARETLETRILQLKHLDIIAAELAGRSARITVKLLSDQINVLRAHDGSIVDGDPDHAIEKTDFWTFARDTRSNDPNWLLVATDSG
jgi:predicted lipid-binding transport protein (Tim44 family)